MVIWLGFIIDSFRQILAIPEKKREWAKSILSCLLSKSKLYLREILKFARLITSMRPVIGPKAYIHTKPLFQEVNGKVRAKVSWGKPQPISQQALDCFHYWQKELTSMSFEFCFKKPLSMALVFSDASSTAGAAFLHANNLSSSDITADLETLEKFGPADWS